MTSGHTGSFPDCGDLQTINWDNARGAFVGIGLYPNKTRTVVAMDAVTGFCDILGSVPGYFYIMAGQAGLDASTGALWALLEPGGGDDSPYYLVSINTRGPVAVTSHNPMQGCPGDDVCPWQLAFYYGTA
jgi:hypothetical protein